MHKQLPKEVIDEVKDLLRKTKAQAGATPYKDLKDRVLETFALDPEDTYSKAKGMLMTGKPSQLLQSLINTLCITHPDLTACCSGGIISGMLREKLPSEVRQAVAGKSIIGKREFSPTES